MLRDIKLATRWVSSCHPPYATNRLRKIVRTCQEKLDTINYVRSLEIQADFPATPDWGVSEDGRAPNLVLQMVSRSPSLSHLGLLLPGTASLQWSPPLSPGHCKGKLFARLQSLYLDCEHGSTPPLAFFSICALPSLKHIETSSPTALSTSLKSLPSDLRGFYSIPFWPESGTSGVGTINATNLSTPCLLPVLVSPNCSSKCPK